MQITKTREMKAKLSGLAKAFAIPVVLYFVLLVLIRERVGSWNSILTMLVLSVVPTITAYGVAFGFVSGIMDFSVGSRMILAGMCAALAGHFLGLPGMLMAAIVSSLLLSLFVGGLYATLKIPSIVVSLGALMIFEIAGMKLSSAVGTASSALATGQYIKTPAALTFLGAVPWNFIILLAAAVLFHFCYDRTRFASQAKMVGSDEIIARNIGLRPMKVKFVTFVVGGVFLGIAAMVSACYSSAVGYKTEMASLAMVFKPMMAVIIGMSLERFVRMSVGVFIGSLCISILFTGIIALGWPDSLQNVILGLFMLLVLAFPTIKSILADSKRRRQARQRFEKMAVGENVYEEAIK